MSLSLPGGSERANEDALGLEQHPLDAGVWLGVLADGQGGRRGGGRAAQLACTTALAELRTTPLMTLARPSFWCEALHRADQAVAADREAGFTTLIALAMHPEFLIGASSGDSAVLLVPATGTGTQLTANQQKNPPIGSGGASATPFSAWLTPSDGVLVVSDGVWKFAGWEGVQTAAQAHRGLALLEELQRRVRPPAGGPLPDDFSVIAFATAE